MPYLHERKVVLNRLKTNTNYFYTSFKVKENDEFSNRQIEQYMDLTETNEVTVIVCFNLLEAKLYMYLENGVILYR
jgi:putative ribosome biogenesis GTPase RsgA